MITIDNLTKDYGENRGIFNMNLRIKEGEVFGIVGVNGAGKTTTLRMLMGFIKPTMGRAYITGKDAWKESATVKSYVGYVPGEIAFPDTKSGQTFLKLQMDLLREKAIKSQRVNELIQKLKIDTTADIKRMSKGMKQKVALVCAFMADAKVLLLDEPTTGLDPVMRDVFIQLIKDAKAKGTTIIMSSHMFNELEPTCDRIAFLKNGKIIEILDQTKMEELHSYQEFILQLKDNTSYDYLLTAGFKIKGENPLKKTLTIIIHETQVNKLIQELGQSKIKNLSIKRMGLDNYFAEELATL